MNVELGAAVGATDTRGEVISRRAALSALTLAGAGACLAGTSRAWAQEKAKDVAWLKEIQTVPAELPANAPRLSELLIDGSGQAITSARQWQFRRRELRDWWLKFLGPFPAERKTPGSLIVVEEDRVDDVIRQRVRYEVEPGLMTEAYLLKPAALQDKAPGMVVFHSTVNYSIRQPAGLEGPPEKHFGLRFARLGCVCLCPRNYLWPTNERISAQPEANKFLKRAPESKGMVKMLYDGLVAMDILASLPGVDAKRLGTVGHSLGAKEALYLAAFDDRVKAAVSSEGGIGIQFSNWEADWYLGKAVKDPSFNRDHHELLAMVAPRPFLLLGGNSADGDRGWPFITAARGVYELFGSPARVGQFNHGKGHAVPPEAEQRIEEWLMTYL